VLLQCVVFWDVTVGTDTCVFCDWYVELQLLPHSAYGDVCFLSGGGGNVLCIKFLNFRL